MKIPISIQPLCVAALLWGSIAPARAATVQFNYGIVSVNFLTGNNVNATLHGFDPTLGTLDAVDVSFSASAVLLQGNAISSRIRVYDGTTLLDTITFPNMVGRAQQAESGAFTVPAANLADFETAGTVDLTLTPFTACRGSAPTPSGCNGFNANVGGTVTYTYTPASIPSSVPEPRTTVLFTVGLICAAFFRCCPREFARIRRLHRWQGFTMTLNRISKLLFAACILGATANASVVVFNFDGDNLGTTTTFTDTDPITGLSATFSSAADPGGFVVYPSTFQTLTGNVLGDPGPAGQDNLTLDVGFSTELTAITLNFATSDFTTPSPLTLQAYQNSILVGSTTLPGMFLSGSTFPEGEIAFGGAGFNRVAISSTATDFAVDNITVATAPEPGPLASFAVGLVCLALGARRRKSRSSAASNN